MRVLVTGGEGQLAAALRRSQPECVDAKFPGRETLDITDAISIQRTVQRFSPDWVINTAAYTAVDRAESETEAAKLVNSVAPDLLGQCCRDNGVRLLQVSTDFVFNGEQRRPYVVDDPLDPQSVYGSSKAEGEINASRSTGGDAVIVRTGWLYGTIGHNFFRTMLRLMLTLERISVVSDQTGAPTLVDDLADCLWQAVSEDLSGGPYHCSNAGQTTWYGFACAIREQLRVILPDRPLAEIAPVSTAEYGNTTPRPAYSVLEFNMGEAVSRPIRFWSEALASLDFAALLAEPEYQALLNRDS